jgi:hypothetical protein
VDLFFIWTNSFLSSFTLTKFFKERFWPVLGGYHFFMITAGSGFHKGFLKPWPVLYFFENFEDQGKGIISFITQTLLTSSQSAGSHKFENS